MTAKYLNESLIDLENHIDIKKKILKNENPKKVVKVIKKTLDFNKQQKGKGLPLDLSRIATVFDRTRLRILTKTSKTNASKINNSTGTSKSRLYI